MNLLKLYYSPRDNGDGSVSLSWFLTQKTASADQDALEEGWGEDCSGEIDSYEGSAQHAQAIENEAIFIARNSLKKGQIVTYDNEPDTIKKVRADGLYLAIHGYVDYEDPSLVLPNKS